MKVISLRLEDEDYKRLALQASHECRSVNKAIQHALKVYLADVTDGTNSNNEAIAKEDG